ncbi:MAG: DUF3238 domain-containing protein [Oscillatoriaceae cyanobacterium Prado104]|jgi:hypothetical protein|nr:DUF3238 domain-containing protein [Oscillatoriaceae cyanobacterium Prado104]
MSDQLKLISLWCRAFIPGVVLNSDGTEFSQTITAAGHTGKKVIPGPLGLLGFFHTDDRTFLSEKTASARAYCEILVDLVSNQVSVASRRCDPTLKFKSLTDSSPESAVGDSSRLVIKDVSITNEPNGGRVLTFNLRGEANNPLAPGSPDIDWDLKVLLEVDTGLMMGRVTVKGLVDPFPAYEMYLSTNLSSPPNQVFQISPAPGKDPWNLIGNPTIPVEGASPIKINIGESLDGTWESTDATKRFRLTINGANVNFIEQRQSGSTFSHATNLVRDAGIYRIERPNTDSILLTFLEFKPATQTEIMSRQPKPSFHLLYRDGDKLRSKWSGLLVTLKPDGSFNELFNPGDKPSKDFEFIKV